MGRRSGSTPHRPGRAGRLWAAIAILACWTVPATAAGGTAASPFAFAADLLLPASAAASTAGGCGAAATARAMLPAPATGAVASRALPSHETGWHVSRDPRNRVTLSCNGFDDRVRERGVFVPGQSFKGAVGYTWVEGFEAGQTPAVGVCARSEQVRRTWEGVCPCAPDKPYTDEIRCNVECPSAEPTVPCHIEGRQCTTLRRSVCIDVQVSLCIAQPAITIYALQWTPVPGQRALRPCRSLAARYNAEVLGHEARHARDTRAAIDRVNAAFRDRRKRFCFDDEAALRREIDEWIADLRRQAAEQAVQAVDAATAGFHASAPPFVLDCHACDLPARRAGRPRR